jgi:ABC-type sugar transport system ATPase subunit
MGEYIFAVQNITKKYPGVTALHDVSVEFLPGEVHALMGENGAGKSTLIKIISGATTPDGGTIVMGGRRFDRMTTRLSRDLGVAVIYQELMMVPEFSVAENVFLGSPLLRFGLVDHAAMRKKTREIFSGLNITIDPGTRVSSFSVAYRQMIEIARALSRNARILIMDEPSASLTEEEVELMLNLVLELKKNGVTVVYISHRLDEVFRIADRITVLRDGQFIKTVESKTTDKQELIQLMVGRSLGTVIPQGSAIIGEATMEIKNFSGNGVRDISFSVRGGEILGVGGLVGAGRTELAQLIFGMVPKENGILFLNGKMVSIKSPRDAVKNKIALIPEDRKLYGLLLESSVRENIGLPLLDKIQYATFIDYKTIGRISTKQQEKLNIKTPSLAQAAKNLSGGNQQKVVLAKWLAAECDYLIFDEPTRGIDVGAKQEIYKLLRELAEQKKTIIMITSEMEELLAISDRIIVLCEGRLMGELQKNDFSQNAVLTLASGLQYGEKS